MSQDAKTNEKEIKKLAVRPEAITIRKDEFFKNARSQFKEEPLASLEESIRTIGLLKPLCVERDPKDKNRFILIAGERRHICITSLKQKNAKCCDNETGDIALADEMYEFVEVKLVAPKDDAERLAIMFAENAEHSAVPDWDIFQFALWLDFQKDEAGRKKYDRPALCKIFNKSSPWVSHTLEIASLPEKVKAALQCGEINRTGAVKLLTAKEHEVVNVLHHAKHVIIRTANEEIAEGEETKKEATIALEVIDVEASQSVSVPDRIHKKVLATRRTDAKRRIAQADSKITKAKALLQKPVITEEAVKQALEEMPEAVKPGAAASAPSTKRVRKNLKSVKKLLDENEGKDYILHEATGKMYLTEDFHLLFAAYEQVLGKGGLDPFSLLDREYDRRGISLPKQQPQACS